MSSRSPRPAHNRRASPRRMAVRSGFPGWAWLLLGLALGAAGAALFYISQNQPAPLAPTLGKVQPPTAPTPSTALPNLDKADSGPSTPAIPDPLANRYEFYELLKKGEVIIPEPDKPKASATPPPPAPPSGPPGAADTPSGRFILQVGSYRRFEDADRVKANLALLGMDATIEKATPKPGEIWYRVRVGPLTDARQMESLRTRMKANGINPLLIRTDG